MTTKQMTSWLTTPLGDRHFPIVIIDGIHLGDHLILIALGIDTEGKKEVLGLREGDTENGQVARALLWGLVDRESQPRITTYTRNAKRWQGGKMVIRWVGAAILEAEKKFRRVQGWLAIENPIRALQATEQKQEAKADRFA